MKQLITPELKDNSFDANGKKYFIEQKISVARKIISDKLVVEIAGGIAITEHFNDLKKMYDLCNKMQFAELAVNIHNKMTGVKNWGDRRDAVLQLCALYINSTDEDRRTITDERIHEKIADWTEAGIDYSFFYVLASALLRQQIENWSAAFQPSLNAQAESKKQPA